MKIISIEDGFERAFWNLVNKDPLNYYFFVFDWTRRRDQTKILLAVEDRRVAGSMLLYSAQGRASVVQLRGNRKAVRRLLDFVDFESVELQAPADCEDIVLRRYRPSFKHTLVLMCLKKGEENFQVKHTPVKLNLEEVGEVVDVMRRADPDVWGDLDVQRQKLAWNDAYMLGMRQDSRLVSVGLTRFVEIGSNIGAIATDAGHRNMGYATSIVSALAYEILRRAPPALIHVLGDNAPAVHVYSKLGFKPFRQYLMIRAKKIEN